MYLAYANNFLQLLYSAFIQHIHAQEEEDIYLTQNIPNDNMSQ